ncbi:hypothetical protein FGB62_18g10 [Gracilaria domingensis]|nr:hypothetical protein FGB62_18g10 [Gracilaria domingensis]
MKVRPPKEIRLHDLWRPMLRIPALAIILFASMALCDHIRVVINSVLIVSRRSFVRILEKAEALPAMLKEDALSCIFSRVYCIEDTFGSVCKKCFDFHASEEQRSRAYGHDHKAYTSYSPEEIRAAIKRLKSYHPSAMFSMKYVGYISEQLNETCETIDALEDVQLSDSGADETAFLDCDANNGQKKQEYT